MGKNWKQEHVQDYKWDYIDVKEFHKTDAGTRFKYFFVFVWLARDIVIYGLDIFTAITMIKSNKWTNPVYVNGGNANEQGTQLDHLHLNFNIVKWVFVGCIIFSFCLIAYEVYFARKAVRSGDISYSFTNIMANRYLSIKDYDKFCLFQHIRANTKRVDDFAFFVFFTFKDWKRTLLADGPRQGINFIILLKIVAVYNFSFDTLKANFWTYKDGDNIETAIMTALLFWSMLITVLIFLVSFIQLLIAAVIYIPLVCHIRGNLKEYVCHKVDKRLGQVMQKLQKRRVQKFSEFERKLAAGEQIVNSKGEVVDATHLRPTLPNVSLDDEERLYGVAGGRLSPAPSIRGRQSPIPPPIYPPLNTDSMLVDYAAYDKYSNDPTHTYPPRMDEGYSSKTSLLGAAAPPGALPKPLPASTAPQGPAAMGLEYPPSASVARAPSTSIARAPSRNQWTGVPYGAGRFALSPPPDSMAYNAAPPGYGGAPPGYGGQPGGGVAPGAPGAGYGAGMGGGGGRAGGHGW